MILGKSLLNPNIQTRNNTVKKDREIFDQQRHTNEMKMITNRGTSKQEYKQDAVDEDDDEFEEDDYNYSVASGQSTPLPPTPEPTKTPTPVERIDKLVLMKSPPTLATTTTTPSLQTTTKEHKPINQVKYF